MKTQDKSFSDYIPEIQALRDEANRRGRNWVETEQEFYRILANFAERIELELESDFSERSDEQYNEGYDEGYGTAINEVEIAISRLRN